MLNYKDVEFKQIGHTVVLEVQANQVSKMVNKYDDSLCRGENNQFRSVKGKSLDFAQSNLQVKVINGHEMINKKWQVAEKYIDKLKLIA